jgi:transcriptional regulator with XRE-family HTH domain
MTPFGARLRYYREERGLTQLEFARQLSVDPKFISSLETGRRRPPSDGLMERIYSLLRLPEDQRLQLHSAAQDSSYVIRIPKGVSPMGLQLAHRLVRSLRCLGPDQIAAIQTLIERGI